MGGLFRFDSKPMRVLGLGGDLILLNLLFVLCSLPVFTVGASISALYTMTFRLKKDAVTGGLVREFFKAFGQNFKKGTLLWLLYSAAGAVLIADYLIVSTGAAPAGTVWKAAGIIAAVLYTVSFSWVFALQAKFENSVRQMIRNSLLVALTNLRVTISAAVLTAVPWILWYYKTDLCFRILPLWLMLIFSLIAYLKTMLFEKIFDRYAGAGETAVSSAGETAVEGGLPKGEAALSAETASPAETALPAEKTLTSEKTPSEESTPSAEKPAPED